MTTRDQRLNRLSLNQKTIDRCSVPQAVRECSDNDIPAIGLWREPVHETGVTRSAKLVRDAGLRVSSLCRGGFFTGARGEESRAVLDDNRRALDEAAELGAPCLVLVVGGLPAGSRDLPEARHRVGEALAELAPYAGERGVRLALEPLHPMYCADRAVVSTLGQALDIAGAFPSEQVGVVVDAFHVWWDPELFTQIDRAADRIASFQVCDWLTPLPADVLLGRGMMGDGHIDFPPLRAAVEHAGYDGDIEVEIFNEDVWNADPGVVVPTTVERYLNRVWA
ncbi:sugar phosphate isomerase/epimerase [Saccharopolyspora lacisalsi]|uniref:Sugar phosphate isomerase/epimerase n=1 Tax=Halosaccharopolyspora lacisalsi TaxID=1000566 RepID=A0A839E1N0_9PSEU|nr:sugar phosphate isomerase/epimerase family protein [Halosaccharopolyspora lacisalsi]MBA8826446.1 sugar phosphate isomerase/epimerase [Halosaccharopolyspora lacisalsi]